VGVLQIGYGYAWVVEMENVVAGDDLGLASGECFLCFVYLHHRRVVEDCGFDCDLHCGDVAEGVGCGNAIGKDAEYVTLVVAGKATD
jgi:hypothetical protein